MGLENECWSKLQGVAAAKFALMLAETMGCPEERVSAQVVDLGMPERTGLVVAFDPPLTPSEQRFFDEIALPIVCVALGTTGPLKMADA